DPWRAAVDARLAAEPSARLRLLEIGAGTGATTAGILDRLAPRADRIAEYCYTDISKAFLFHAEREYAPTAPYLRTLLLNVEKPLAGQDVAPGSYDFVVAANVIHATRNIRNTLRNAKALLRRGGALLMNEISLHSVCGHLTFGLLDGWWLNEDDEVRIPGSPGLFPEAWRR
ncbi:class I SAM-dependent methyltransferase, partial [Pseudogulbenkiania ferrooxidans]|uniref:class I SAM-dependent methyltransferase n=1 Tax=Pseudogulbenkiania ferrooxidans TaxID=549169 RepID=UPI0013789757